jgi:hypothetical protein
MGEKSAIEEEIATFSEDVERRKQARLRLWHEKQERLREWDAGVETRKKKKKEEEQVRRKRQQQQEAARKRKLEKRSQREFQQQGTARKRKLENSSRRVEPQQEAARKRKMKKGELHQQRIRKQQEETRIRKQENRKQHQHEMRKQQGVARKHKLEEQKQQRQQMEQTLLTQNQMVNAIVTETLAIYRELDGCTYEDARATVRERRRALCRAFASRQASSAGTFKYSKAGVRKPAKIRTTMLLDSHDQHIGRRKTQPSRRTKKKIGLNETQSWPTPSSEDVLSVIRSAFKLSSYLNPIRVATLVAQETGLIEPETAKAINLITGVSEGVGVILDAFEEV